MIKKDTKRLIGAEERCVPCHLVEYLLAGRPDSQATLNFWKIVRASGTGDVVQYPLASARGATAFAATMVTERSLFKHWAVSSASPQSLAPVEAEDILTLGRQRIATRQRTFGRIAAGLWSLDGDAKKLLPLYVISKIYRQVELAQEENRRWELLPRDASLEEAVSRSTQIFSEFGFAYGESSEHADRLPDRATDAIVQGNKFARLNDKYNLSLADDLADSILVGDEQVDGPKFYAMAAERNQRFLLHLPWDEQQHVAVGPHHKNVVAAGATWSFVPDPPGTPGRKRWVIERHEEDLDPKAPPRRRVLMTNATTSQLDLAKLIELYCEWYRRRAQSEPLQGDGTAIPASYLASAAHRRGYALLTMLHGVLLHHLHQWYQHVLKGNDAFLAEALASGAYNPYLLRKVCKCHEEQSTTVSLSTNKSRHLGTSHSAYIVAL